MSGSRSAPAESSPRRNSRLGALLLMFGAIAGLVVVLAFSKSDRSHDERLRSARQSFALGDYRAAEAAAAAALDAEPESLAAMTLAAESAVRLGDPDRAVRYFEVPEDAAAAAEMHSTAGELLREQGYLSAALEQFRQAVRRDPDHTLAHRRLAFLYGVAARNYEAMPHRLRALDEPRVTPAEVFAVSMGDDFLENPELLAEFHRDNPADPLPKLGLARAALAQRRYAEAQTLLEDVVAAEPGNLEARVNLGRVFLALGHSEQLWNWFHDLPEGEWSHPGIGMVCGEWAERQGDVRAAVRCYCSALRLDPESAESNYQLGRLLSVLDEGALAEPFLTRASRLRGYTNDCYAVITRESDKTPVWQQDVRSAAESAETLGLTWEAAAWKRIAAGMAGANSEDEESQSTSRAENSVAAQWPFRRSPPEANPAVAFPIQDYPAFVPQQEGRSPEKPPHDSTAGSRPSPTIRIRFRDDAESAGLGFTYFNDGFPRGPGRHLMYEFTGGGAGVLDFDQDGAPDVFFPQGCRWPPESRGRDYVDALFRNVAGTRFQQVERQARVAEDRYSQGVGVGDLNADGFPDLYITNIGGNRLFINCGDGTFSDETAAVSGDAQQWSTSCALADLDGDALPDVYCVNYLGGEDVFTRVCRNIDGTPETCLPQNFDAAPDQVFLSAGDGRFIDATKASGCDAPGGKGLGIIAADFQSSGRLSVFVANDQTPNFFFTTSDPDSTAEPWFVERGLPSGLALNERGQTEACMGIAVGDADGDGRLDLFVTNFEHESNTLYLQRDAMSFVDQTDRFGLAVPSLPMLGFGTQFLDPDLDGDLDLLVSNGHIHQTGRERMPPQFFVNHDGRTFSTLTPNEPGPYFEGAYLGRGMARLDWNGDGREDAVVTHLDAPSALLTNAGRSPGNCLRVRLIGTRSNRDAIGASVTVRTGDRTLFRQITAGDGYLSSNERVLTFGLGLLDRVDEVRVRWPSGETHTFSEIPANRLIAIREDGALHAMRSFDDADAE